MERIRAPLTAVEAYKLVYGPAESHVNPIVALQLSGMDLGSADGKTYRCEVRSGFGRGILALAPQPSVGKGAYSLSIIATSTNFAMGILERVLIKSNPRVWFRDESEKLGVICGLGLN